MKKMNLFLAAAAFSMGALAEVNYQVVPLPQTIQLDESGKTTRDGVYAGGDAVTGAATVILAMGAGKAAAQAIDDYINNKA